MSNGFQEAFPYLQQMTDQFRKIFGDDFVKNLMGSMQTPNWWQQYNNSEPWQGGPQPNDRGPFGNGSAERGPRQGNPAGGDPSSAWPNIPAPGWNPFAQGQNPTVPQHGGYPVADIYETHHEVVLVLEVPGMERSGDIRISVHPESVVVKGEVVRKYDRTHEPMYATERFTGGFERRFTLPARVRKQHAKAIYRAGLLEIRLLKEGKPVDGDGTVLDVDFL